MKKKLVIGLSILVGVIAIAVTLCFTVFTVKTIEVDFRTSLSQGWNEESIISSGDFNYGRCILFLSKKGYVQKLEEENPYLEVINIETVFPSKLIIHCAERQELYAFQKDENIIFCDKDFKVLKIENGNYISSQTNAILLKNLTITQDFKVGDFLDIGQKGMKRFYSSMLENSKDLSQVLGFCKEISFSKEMNYLTNKEEIHANIRTFADRDIKILNIDTSLTYKLQRMFQTLPTLYELLVEKGNYTSEEVNRCSLVIGNQITNENEIYTHIYLDGEIIQNPNKE